MFAYKVVYVVIKCLPIEEHPLGLVRTVGVNRKLKGAEWSPKRYAHELVKVIEKDIADLIAMS